MIVSLCSIPSGWRCGFPCWPDSGYAPGVLEDAPLTSLLALDAVVALALTDQGDIEPVVDGGGYFASSADLDSPVCLLAPGEEPSEFSMEKARGRMLKERDEHNAKIKDS